MPKNEAMVAVVEQIPAPIGTEAGGEETAWVWEALRKAQTERDACKQESGRRKNRIVEFERRRDELIAHCNKAGQKRIPGRAALIGGHIRGRIDVAKAINSQRFDQDEERFFNETISVLVEVILPLEVLASRDATEVKLVYAEAGVMAATQACQEVRRKGALAELAALEGPFALVGGAAEALGQEALRLRVEANHAARKLEEDSKEVFRRVDAACQRLSFNRYLFSEMDKEN